MYDLVISKNIELGGKTYRSSEVLSKVGLGDPLEPLIPIAWAGTLTTRTDNDTGEITMTDAGHLITTGAKVDIYWTNADGTTGSRRGVTTGVVAGLAVPFGAGAPEIGLGDNLPIATTVVQVALMQSYTVSIAGNNLAALVANADLARATIVLMSTGDTVEELPIVLAANGAYDWLSTSGQANPILGDNIDKIHMSHNDITQARLVRIGMLMNV